MKNKKLRKCLIIVGIAIQVVTVIFLVVSALFTMWSNTTSDHTLVKSFKGTVVLTSRGSNMKTEYGQNDILFFETYQEGEKVEKGDIICFYKYVNGAPVLSTMRVHEETVVDSKPRVLLADDKGETSGYYITYDNIIGVYTGKRLIGLGAMVEAFAANSTTFFLSVIMPLAVFFIIDAFFLVKFFLEKRSENEEDEESIEDTES